MIELCHMDVRHFLIEKCRHLSIGFTDKCGCIGLILFRYLSSERNNMRYQCCRICLGICMHRLRRFASKGCKCSLGDSTVHEIEWTSDFNRRNDSAHKALHAP